MIEQQIHAADLIILNKIDLVDDPQRAKVQTWIQSLAPRARVLEARHAAVPLELLLGVGRYRIQLELAAPMHDHHEHADEHDGHEHHDHDHSAEFMSWSYTSDQPLALRTTRDTLKQLPVAIVRAKGILFTADVPDRRVIFQLVGKRMSLTVGEPWGDAQPYTQLVAISTPGGIDSALLTAGFDACRQQVKQRNSLSAAWEWVRGGRSV
jgi:G3E family GTPase